MARALPPSLPGRPFTGNLRSFNTDTLNYLHAVHALGPIATLKFGPFNAFILNDPEWIHQVLVTHADQVHKTTVTKRAMDLVVGNGLFTNDGESWKRQRRLAQPAFHTRRIGAYAETITRYTGDATAAWQDGDTVRIDHEMAELTMRIIAKVLFDADITVDAQDVGRDITHALEEMNTRFNQLFQLPDWLPTPGNRRLKRAVHNLDQLIQGFIDARRNTGEDKGDLLSMLLLAREADGSGGMTDKQVRDEAMTLFGAGHETTANALMWTWYLLAQHPHIEAKLHAELDAALDGRAPTLADLPNLPYTERVVKEAMRLYPPAWAFTREAVQPFDLNGFPVHPRDVLLVNVYGLHHSAQYFPQPETFDPDRWTPAFEKALPRYAYIPFGGGPRVCIGNAFAMMEARLVLAAIAQRFALRLVPGYPVVPRRVFTLRAAHGIAMQVQVRTAAHTPVVEAAAPMPT